MRISELENILRQNGYYLAKNSRHKIYSNGKHSIPVPHCRELNRFLAKRIIRQIQVAAEERKAA